MKAPIFITSQALACGALITEAMMRSHAEKTTPHLIIAEPLLTPEKALMELKLKYYEPINIDPRLLRQSAYDRSHPNQPWYSKFQKRRSHRNA